MKTHFLIAFIALTGILCGCDFPKISKLNNSSATPQAKQYTNQIILDSNNLTPKKIVVKKNTTVVFINKDKNPHIVASNPHPEHNQLPDLYSTAIFKDQSFSYTFKKKGAFGFHLEDNPSISGEIVVE